MLAINGNEKKLMIRGKEKKKVAPPKRLEPIKAALNNKLKLKPITKSPSKVLVSQNALNNMDYALRKLSNPPENNSNCGQVKLRFNHYNKEFPIYNGVLKWADVDLEYCFSFVYKGNYTRNIFSNISVPSSSGNTAINNLFNNSNNPTKSFVSRDDDGVYFIDMTLNTQYFIEIIEDPIAGVGIDGVTLNTSPLTAKKLQSIQITPSASPNKSKISNSLSSQTPNHISGNHAVRELTNELKAMKASDLNSQEALDLKERRDLEDILYSDTINDIE